MRIREYNEAAPPSTRAGGARACVEYHLSTASPSDGSKGKGDGVDDGRLIWSTVRCTQDADDKLKTGGANQSPGFIKSAEQEVVRITSKLRQLCKDLFLPIGYPTSVADGYLEYQFYDSLQGLCSYLRGVVSTSAVLTATGVGDAQATALSAAMTWAVRDGLGMIGGLLFSYVASPHFDAYVKEFRLLADVLNDVALTLDMALPLVLSWMASSESDAPSSWGAAVSSYLPSTYLVLTSTSMLCKVACGMAAGATKGNITDHFAISGNRADCQSKESTQETLVSLIGMCCGVWLAKVLHQLENTGASDACAGVDEVGGVAEIANTCTNNDNNQPVVDAQTVSWSIFIILTLVHVWANYVGMRVLRLRTLNRERTRAAVQPLVEECSRRLSTESNGCDKNASSEGVAGKADSLLLPPQSVSEPLWKSMYGMFSPGKVHLGLSLKDLVRRSSSSPSRWIQGHWKSENYMIFIEDCRGTKNKDGEVVVLLRVGASDRDELKAFFHSHVLDLCMQNESVDFTELTERSYEMIQSVFKTNSIDGSSPGQASTAAVDVYDLLHEKGWDATRLYLEFGPWRCQWEDAKYK